MRHTTPRHATSRHATPRHVTWRACCFIYRHTPHSSKTRKGTNGVSTNGVTANVMFFVRGTFSVLPLTCFCFSKSARAYLFPQSVKINYLFSSPISVDPICPQPNDKHILFSQTGESDSCFASEDKHGCHECARNNVSIVNLVAWMRRSIVCDSIRMYASVQMHLTYTGPDVLIGACTYCRWRVLTTCVPIRW